MALAWIAGSSEVTMVYPPRRSRSSRACGVGPNAGRFCAGTLGMRSGWFIVRNMPGTSGAGSYAAGSTPRVGSTSIG